MPLLDRIKDTVTGLVPQKKEQIPLPTTSGGGIGVHYGEDNMIISKPFIVAASLQIFFSFVAMCCFASVSAFQARYGVGPSALSGFSVFIAVFTVLLSTLIVVVPVLYDKYDKFSRFARALREPRVQFVMNGGGAILTLLAGFITTISAYTQAGCKDATKDPNADMEDEGFVLGLPDWCRTKKAGSAFFWFSFLAWLAAVGLTFNEWRTGKRIYRPKDPPFQRPVETGVTHHEDDDRDEPFTPRRNDTYDDPRQPTSPFEDNNRYNGRPSMDAYGAFNDPTPSGYGQEPQVSRTMQYADPYSAVNASLYRGQASPTGNAPPRYDY